MRLIADDTAEILKFKTRIFGNFVKFIFLFKTLIATLDKHKVGLPNRYTTSESICLMLKYCWDLLYP